MTKETLPNPAPQPKSPLDMEFWEHCDKGILCFQRCISCMAWRHLPRYMCPKCGSPDWKWQQSTGRGQVYSWTISHTAMSPEFKNAVPYAVIMVEMEEGVRVISGLKNIDYRELAIGLPVEATFEPLASGRKLFFFTRQKGFRK